MTTSSKSQKRGKYNSYSTEQHAKIGKYAAEQPGKQGTLLQSGGLILMNQQL